MKTLLPILALFLALFTDGFTHAQTLQWAPVGTKWIFGYEEWEPESGPDRPEYSAYGVLEVKAASTFEGKARRHCWLEICATCDVRSHFDVELLQADSATLYRVLWGRGLVPARDCNATDTLSAYHPLFYHCPPDSVPVIISVNSIDSLCYQTTRYVRDTIIRGYRLCLHDVWPEEQQACGLKEIEPCEYSDFRKKHTSAAHFKQMNKRSRSVEGIGLLDVVPPFFPVGRDASDWGRESHANLRCFFHTELGWINFETNESNSEGCFRFRGTGSRPIKPSRAVRYSYQPTAQQITIHDPELHSASCSVFDALGREIVNARLGEGVLGIESLPEGVLFVRLKDHAGQFRSFHFLKY